VLQWGFVFSWEGVGCFLKFEKEENKQNFASDWVTFVTNTVPFFVV